MNRSGFYINHSQFQILNSTQRHTHAYVIGQPGTGKSRLIESWVMQDILSGQGVGVIDPHGDLYRNLLYRIAQQPEIWPRVIIVDPCNPKWAINLNPLYPKDGISPEKTAWFLTDIILKIWRTNSTDAPRMAWLMVNTFIALAEAGLSLLELPRFLIDQEFREQLLPRIHNEYTQLYFRFEFPKNSGAVHQWVTPLLNKLGQLILDSDIRPMLIRGQGLDFRKVLDDRCILLVNISKGILGDGPSALLGAFIVAQLQKAALARANQYHRSSFFLYLDEFQNYTTDNIKDILSESRKYALSLILANQYLNQLTPDIRSAVLNTSGTLISFRVGYEDATQLAKAVFPSPDFLTKTKAEFSLQKMMSYPYLSFMEKKEGLGWDGLAQRIAGLPNREFWARNRNSFTPIRCRSFDMPNPIRTKDIEYKVQALIETSGSRYARLKSLNQSGGKEDFRTWFSAQGSESQPARESNQDWPLWER